MKSIMQFIVGMVYIGLSLANVGELIGAAEIIIGNMYCIAAWNSLPESISKY